MKLFLGTGEKLEGNALHILPRCISNEYTVAILEEKINLTNLLRISA